METLVVPEVNAKVETTKNETAPAPAAGDNDPDRRDEIHELLRIKKMHKIDGRTVPCPSCTVPVEITINQCPFCESDIAAETALARETTRRLRELSGELDREHHQRPGDEEPKPRGFFDRLKYLFEGDPKPDPNANKIDPYAKRLLSNISPGDSVKVLDEDGPWLKVKTMAGEIGWVYSTVRKGQ
jgi:hypothetical protein